MESLKENYSVWDLMTCRSFTHRVSCLAVGWMEMILCCTNKTQHESKIGN